MSDPAPETDSLDVIRAGAEPSVVLLDLYTPDMDGLGFGDSNFSLPKSRESRSSCSPGT